MSEELPSGFWIEEISKKEHAHFMNYQTYYDEHFVRYNPGGQILPRTYTRHLKSLLEFEVKQDDIWVCSFPKCGTTWTQEMVWNIMNNVDIESAKKSHIDIRFPFIEYSAMVGDKPFLENMKSRAAAGSEESKIATSIELVASKPSPRLIKTHLSADMLPRQINEKNPKVIYIARNPRDTCVSYYYHWKLIHDFSGSFDSVFNSFISDVGGYHLPFFQHVLGFWEMKDRKNVLFLTYEQMKLDLPGVIRKTVEFLGKSLSEEQLARLEEHLSFRSMKGNKTLNSVKGIPVQDCTFIRKGATGDWKNYMTEEQTELIKQWEKRNLDGTGLEFIYEIVQ